MKRRALLGAAGTAGLTALSGCLSLSIDMESGVDGLLPDKPEPTVIEESEYITVNDVETSSLIFYGAVLFEVKEDAVGKFDTLRITGHTGEVQTVDVDSTSQGEQEAEYRGRGTVLEAGDTALVAVLEDGDKLDQAKIKFVRE